ncbi:MAG: CapA family protein, partial [Solobacterium sp.]|nr:CapA family protein [Solobacterium sp.]
STATNHTLDRGEVAVLNSYNYWKSKSDQILMAGTYDSWEAQQEIPVREINGITYTMINYTYGMNGLLAPEGREYLVNCYDGRKDELVEKVRQANEMVDVVIVAMHWGTEYSMEANDEQRELAQRLSEAGADIIVGNHPHVIQPIEWVNNTIVYYAMGNLISAQFNLENKIGMYGTVRIVKTVTGDDVKVEILEPRADLSYTFMDGNNKNIKVYPFSELNDSILPGYEEIYERFKAKINEYDDSIIVGGI